MAIKTPLDSEIVTDLWQLTINYLSPNQQVVNHSLIDPNPDLENKTSYLTGHCEHLKGAWQSHWKV
jgi:hypothetical protein